MPHALPWGRAPCGVAARPVVRQPGHVTLRAVPAAMAWLVWGVPPALFWWGAQDSSRFNLDTVQNLMASQGDNSENIVYTLSK